MSRRPVPPNHWRVVTSHKQQREGEAFVLRGDTFVFKVYRDGVPDPQAFARGLAAYLNAREHQHGIEHSVLGAGHGVPDTGET